MVGGEMHGRHTWRWRVLLAPIEVVVDHLSLLKLLHLRIMPCLNVRRCHAVILSVLVGTRHHRVVPWGANLTLMGPRGEHRLLLHDRIHAGPLIKLIAVVSMRVMSMHVISASILMLALILQLVRLINLGLLINIFFRCLFLYLLALHLLVFISGDQLFLNKAPVGVVDLQLLF